MIKTKCPLTNVMTFFNKKWVLILLYQLSLNGPKRFNELEHQIEGINSRILAQRLKEMEEIKIITRTSYKEIPPRVEYTLTPKGKELLKCFKYLGDWAIKWQ